MKIFIFSLYLTPQLCVEVFFYEKCISKRSSFDGILCCLIYGIGHICQYITHFGKALFDVFKYIGVEDIAYNQPAGVLYKSENPFA